MRKVFKWILRFAIVGAVLGVAALTIAWFVITPGLPEVDTLRDVRLQVPLRIYSADNRLISVFGEKRRVPARLDEIPDQLSQAFIAGEDARFYEHPGVDWQGLSRAAWVLLTTGEKSVGGSTITQQLARNFFLTFEKTYARKAKEILLAVRIEDELSKEEILELYLNKIYLGNRAYGVGAAAEVYYGKTLDELTLAQSAMIAALPKAPSRINPINQPERAMERREYVLGRMLALNFINQSEYGQAMEERDDAYYHGATAEVSAPYFAEMVRAEMVARHGNDAYSSGFEVWTTLDSRLQAAANEAVTAGLEQYDQRHGFRGPEAHLELSADSTVNEWNEALAAFRPVGGLAPGIVTQLDPDLALVYLANGQTVALTPESVAWAKRFIDRDRFGNDPESLSDVLQRGDVVRLRLMNNGEWTLGQVPEAEASLISIDARSGAIRSLVGGFDFSRSKYNRVTQSRRQPGSSFKPFLYSAALESGFTTASLVNDAPIVFEDTELERTWKPENFSQEFFGPTRLREAMVNSRNLVSIRLLRDIGIPQAREYITRFGFEPDELPRDLTMALGSASVTPLSMARAYGTFANGGYLVEPWFITRILDGRGQLVFEMRPPVLCDGDCEIPEATVEAAEEQPSEPIEPEFRPLALQAEDQDVEISVTGSTTVTVDRPDPKYLEPVITPQNAYLIRSMMMDVVRRGTGRKAMEIGRNDLAGKTGTTNEQRDAWFNGYNDTIVTTVWVGFDSHEPLGRSEVGGRAALPIWVDYMTVALENVPEELPIMPDGLAQARIDPNTGLLAPLEQSGTIMEVFQSGQLPAMGEATQGASPDAKPEEDPYDIY